MDIGGTLLPLGVASGVGGFLGLLLTPLATGVRRFLKPRVGPPSRPPTAAGRIASLRLAWLGVRILLVGAGTWFAWTAFWQLYVGFPGSLNFYVHHARFEEIVAQAKTMPLDPGSGKN